MLDSAGCHKAVRVSEVSYGGHLERLPNVHSEILENHILCMLKFVPPFSEPLVVVVLYCADMFGIPTLSRPISLQHLSASRSGAAIAVLRGGQGSFLIR
jgi:hypothetical protein